MAFSARQRFILRTTIGYAIFALAWIFLSDQLLGAFADMSRVVWLSTAKGLGFVVVTTSALFFVLRAVPATGALSPTQAEAGLLRQQALLGWPLWLCYGFALVASGVWLLILNGLSVAQDGLLIMLMTPVILSAAMGGLGPGLCATLVCAVLVRFDSSAAWGFAAFRSPYDLVQWSLLIVNGALVSVLCEVLRRAWMRLETSGLQHSVILGSVAEAVIALDMKGRITYLNVMAERLTGCPAAEAIGLPLATVFLPTDPLTGVAMSDLTARIESASQGFACAALLRNRAQQQIAVYLQASTVRLEGNARVGFVLVVRDETAHHALEERLRKSNELLQEMGALAHVGGWELDPATRSGSWTRELALIHDLDPDTVGERVFGLDFLEGRWRILVEAALEQLIRDGTPYTLELEIRTAKGVRKWVRSVAVPVYAEGVLVKVRGATQDISAKKQAEDALRASEARYARVIEGADQGFWELNVQTQQFDFNPRFATMLGYAPNLGEVSPNAWHHYVHPDDLAKALLSIEAHLAGKLPLHEAELRIRAASGEWKWILTRGRIVQWDTEGKPLIMSGTHTDISERKAAEAALRLAAAVFENAQESVVVTDAARTIVMVNAAFCRLTGFASEDVLGKPSFQLVAGASDERAQAQLWAEVDAQGCWQGELWGCRKDDDPFPELVSISAVRDEHGEIINYVQVFTDISRLKASEERLDYLAHHDPLTQLPNRLLLFSRLDHALATARRDGGVVALLMFDLDRFKDINDSFGHLLGDQLLLQVAERLSARLRAADFFARLGGDEFTVLLDGLTRPEDAARVAGEIIHNLAQPFRLANGAEIQCSASIGISLFPGHGDTAESLLQQADTAMYRAKAEGRGHFQYFSESMTQAARDRIGLDARLRRALAQDELRVHYQPLVDIATDRIVGAEALVRWLDPDEGLIPPLRFIPIAEETGLIREIGSWVLRETCRQGREWLDAGFAPLVLAVNVSAHQVRHDNFGELVDRVLEACDFPPELLELELTESTLMEQRADMVALFDRLRARKIRLAIDDFGTGYSSLAYLKRFPLDILKIDKGFIADISQDSDDREITLAIISMAHSLGFKVLAEGVETAEQLAFLKANGCDMYQGYYRSKPLPAEAFVKLLAPPEPA